MLNSLLVLCLKCKVHGGTSEDDVCMFIKQAEKISKENKMKNLDTVVFFDEANTTDAIGLIKEVVCDRRIYGKPVSNDLKFIAACNPYRRYNVIAAVAMGYKRLALRVLGIMVR